MLNLKLWMWWWWSETDDGEGDKVKVVRVIVKEVKLVRVKLIRVNFERMQLVGVKPVRVNRWVRSWWGWRWWVWRRRGWSWWERRWAFRGDTYMETRHRAADVRPKVNGGHGTGACWAPRAVHRDRQLHCACRLYCDPRGRHQHCPSPNQWVMAWWYWTVLQELKNRPFRTTTCSLKWAAGHVLATFSTLQRRPTCSSLINI